VWRVEHDGQRTLLLDSLRPPLNGLTFHRGSLYVSTGDGPGQIIRRGLDGSQRVIVDDLPGPGNYHVNEAVFGPDGKLYFSQGAMTNSGVVGLDAYELGWLRRLPHGHDIPGLEIELAGVNFETSNPLSKETAARALTGAFVPFCEATRRGQRVRAELPATAAVMRCNSDGSELELVAWGLRNAWGLGFLADGRLLATDQGADERGSRPIGNAPDLLYHVRAGEVWYGWPDFIGAIPVTDPRFAPEHGLAPSFVLANHNELPTPERPLLRFPPHVAPVKFDLAPPGAPRWAGQLIVACFGDEAPMTAPGGRPQAGRTIVRIDPSDWTLRNAFIDGPLKRPIDVRFSAAGDQLLILDFGHFEMRAGGGVEATPSSGKLWRLRLA
jgi:glucose/arabinose dehydrogenase